MTNDKFWDSYHVIMKEIDTRPNTRPLFHALVNLGLVILQEEEE